MKGYRTYLTIAIAAAYLIGGKFGLWSVDSQVLVGLGLAMAAFLRASIGTPEQVAKWTADQVVAVACLCVAGSLLTGCTTYRTEQLEVSKDGTRRLTILKARSFFDSAAKLTGARALTTDKSQSSAVANLDQQANGTNAVALADSVVQAAVRGAVQGATGR